MTQQLKGYLPLFATNILMNYVEEDTDDLKEHCIKSPDQLTRSHKQNKTEEEKALAMEDNFRILEEYPRISDILLNKFKIAAKEMLGIPKTEFIITTSWITLTEPGYDSQYHNHKNSFYSGVYYFDEYVENCGDIEFQSPLGMFEDYYVPTELNSIANARSWRLPAQSNILLFFPSYLNHRVTENRSGKSRYSLAFNVVPTGFYGVGDSVMDTAWINGPPKNSGLTNDSNFNKFKYANHAMDSSWHKKK